MKSLSHKCKYATVATATLLLTLSNVTPAMASEPEESIDMTTAVEAAYSAEKSIGDSSINLTADSAGEEVAADTNGVNLTLPADTSQPAVLSSDKGTISVTLPASESEAPAESPVDGAIAYDNGDGSVTVPIAGDDGGLQINTVITSIEAPRRYDYSLDLPRDAQVIEKNGAIVVLDASDSLLLMIAPAWATDADGASVPTRYEVSGNTITQVVDHDDSFAYPVVADPWMNMQLFQGFRTSTWGGDVTYNAWVTPGAILTFGVLTGGVVGNVSFKAVMNDSGWKEWIVKWPAIANTKTYKPSVIQQFKCHVDAGVYGVIATQEYNLERARVNRADYGSYIWEHRCNWKYATGGARN